VALDCLISAGCGDEVAGFVDSGAQGKPTIAEYDGFPVLGSMADVEMMRSSGVRKAVVAVGEIASREALFRAAEEAGFDLVNAIHPTAVICRNVTLRRNVIAAPGAVVAVGCDIGDGVLLNTACSVDHDCVVEEFAHICPGTHLAGKVRVCRGAWVGIGSCVVQGVRIGEGTFVGAGSTVLRDLPAGVLAYGSPARVVRDLAGDERGRIIT
jgi:sugar O-acyltransferase (sialic acid O-acetyltransferase NeuD family)